MAETWRARAGHCRTCGKPLARGLYCYEPCFKVRLKAKRPCRVCNRAVSRASALHCSTPVCKAWRQRRAVEATKRRKAGREKAVNYCPCGKALPYRGTVGRPLDYCSTECRQAAQRARDALRRLPYKRDRTRDPRVCPKCEINLRAVTATKVRAWCRPCENRDKRERVYGNVRAMQRLLKPGQVAFFDAISASN